MSLRVSLKSKIGAIELHRLVSDVRRRVEHEITFEGTERRIKWVIDPPDTSLSLIALLLASAPLFFHQLLRPFPTSLLAEVFHLLTATRMNLHSPPYSRRHVTC